MFASRIYESDLPGLLRCCTTIFIVSVSVSMSQVRATQSNLFPFPDPGSEVSLSRLYLSCVLGFPDSYTLLPSSRFSIEIWVPLPDLWDTFSSLSSDDNRAEHLCQIPFEFLCSQVKTNPLLALKELIILINV